MLGALVYPWCCQGLTPPNIRANMQAAGSPKLPCGAGRRAAAATQRPPGALRAPAPRDVCVPVQAGDARAAQQGGEAGAQAPPRAREDFLAAPAAGAAARKPGSKRARLAPGARPRSYRL